MAMLLAEVETMTRNIIKEIDSLKWQKAIELCGGNTVKESGEKEANKEKHPMLFAP